MEKLIFKNLFTFWFFLSTFLTHNLLIPVLSRTPEGLTDQKNYYTPSTPSEPHTGSPPHRSSGGSHSHGSPPSGGSYGGPPSGGGGSYGSPPHGSSGTTPSHGGGGSYGTPSQGGGYYYSPPAHSTPAITPPSTPTYDPPITVPSISTPTVPSVPSISAPSTPYLPFTPVIPDPNGPPFFGTCNFWRDHPGAIWGVFGYFVTVGGIFGALCTPVYGRDVSLQQALSNTRRDGVGLLYREGTASLLNSMVNKKFPFTPQQVKTSFNAALVSDKEAAAQAEVFKKANEGRLKIRA